MLMTAAWSLGVSPITFFTVFFPFEFCAGVLSTLRWRDRSRRLGQLLVDLNCAPKSRISLPVVCSAVTIPLFAWSTEYSISLLEITFYVSFVGTWVWFYFFYGRGEIREFGFVGNGDVVLWRDVSSYSWEASPREFDILRYRVKTMQLSFFRSFSNVHQLLVPRSARQAVNSILAQQFLEWPS